jgi:hypothetical protein
VQLNTLLANNAAHAYAPLDRACYKAQVPCNTLFGRCVWVRSK